MDRYKRLAKNTFFLTIGSFGSKIITFFMVRYYTSVLSTSQYGIVDLITSTAGFLIPILSLDIHEAVFRFSIDRTIDKKSVFGNSLIVLALGNALLAAFLAFLPIETGVFQYKYLLLLFCITDSVYVVTANFCRGLEKTTLYAVSGILHAVLQVVFAFLFISGLKNFVFKGIDKFSVKLKLKFLFL